MRIPFNDSAGSSLGIEMELQIVDRLTRGLASAATPLLAELAAGPEKNAAKVKHELFECTVEVITGINMTVAEARADLAATLDGVTAQADRRGLGLLCSGSHPFSPWHEQQISPDPRYADLVTEMQWAARRLQIFGVHFHVGVRSSAKAIAIANGLTAYLPYFLALSASSPYWSGHDTGMASCRSTVFEALPTAGLPYPMADWEEFEQFMTTLVAARAISTIREVWWDIRPHPDFGTVELRMCDGITSLREVAALAALAQSAVEHLDRRLDAGAEVAVPRDWVVRQNKWRAARHGLAAEVIVDDHGSLAPLTSAVSDLVEELMPVAASLGCDAELAHNLAIVEDGASYQRQRRLVAAGGSLADVVDSLVHELEADR
ncbi:MAG: glutamate--cysteine ligase [Acidimicrobiales bacterium]